MDFLSSLYRNIKIGVAGLGGAGSITCIVAGSVLTHGVIGIVMIVGGSVWLLTSGFVLFDSIKVHSLIAKDVKRLKKLTKEFQKENYELKTNVQELHNVKEKFRKQNIILQQNVEASVKQIHELTLLKKDYETNNQAGQQNVEKMRAKIETLDQIKETLKKKLKTLSGSLRKANKEAKVLQTLKIGYEKENTKLQIINVKNESMVKKLKKEVEKLKELYDGTKKLLVKLATAGDMFEEFGNTIGSTAKELSETKEGYDDTLNRMNRLTESLTKKTFGDLDTDKDGTITKREFQDYVKK